MGWGPGTKEKNADNTKAANKSNVYLSFISVIEILTHNSQRVDVIAQIHLMYCVVILDAIFLLDGQFFDKINQAFTLCDKVGSVLAGDWTL